MNNKKSLLQDSLQELENIKNESLELAKEQLINESADLLEKKSAELFEKLISEGEEEIDVQTKSKKSDGEEDSEEELEIEPSEDDDEESEEEHDEEECDDEEEDDINFDDEDSDEEFMSVKVDEKVIAESKYDVSITKLFQALDKENISDEKLKDLKSMKKKVDDVMWKNFESIPDNSEELAKKYMKKKGVLAEAKSVTKKQVDDYNKQVDAYKFFIVDLILSFGIFYLLHNISTMILNN
jgi:hypothetical protein